jgi:hypothetical protein
MKITAFYVCWDKKRECWMFRTVPFEATGFWCRLPGEFKDHQRSSSPGRKDVDLHKVRKLVLSWVKDRQVKDGSTLYAGPNVEIRMPGACQIENIFKESFTRVGGGGHG